MAEYQTSSNTRMSRQQCFTASLPFVKEKNWWDHHSNEYKEKLKEKIEHDKKRLAAWEKRDEQMKELHEVEKTQWVKQTKQVIDVNGKCSLSRKMTRDSKVSPTSSVLSCAK